MASYSELVNDPDAILTFGKGLSTTPSSIVTAKWFTIPEAKATLPFRFPIVQSDVLESVRAATLCIYSVAHKNFLPRADIETTLRICFDIIIKNAISITGEPFFPVVVTNPDEFDRLQLGDISEFIISSNVDVTPPSFRALMSAVGQSCTPDTVRLAFEAFLTPGSSISPEIESFIKDMIQSPSPNYGHIRYCLMFFRLCARKPDSMVDLLLRPAGEKLLQESNLPAILFDARGLTTIGDIMPRMKQTVVWHLAHIILKAPNFYAEFRKWIGSRWEYSGLVVLTAMFRIDKALGVRMVLRNMIEEGMEPMVLKLMATYFHYCACPPEIYDSNSDINKLLGQCTRKKITEDDGKLGRFAKVFDPSFLHWAGLYNNDKLSARLVGGSMYLADQPINVPPGDKVNISDLHVGANLIKILLQKKVQDDKVATDALKDAVALTYKDRPTMEAAPLPTVSEDIAKGSESAVRPEAPSSSSAPVLTEAQSLALTMSDLFSRP